MRTDDFILGGLGRTLFRMTWPMLFGVLSLLGFQLVDAAFIGQLGVEPLAALGFTLPMTQLFIFTFGWGLPGAACSRALPPGPFGNGASSAHGGT
jgi:Na+-driven multidrug efflux pump